MISSLRMAATSLVLLASLVTLVPSALAESASAVTKLDPMQILGTYYTIERLPIPRQKHCVGEELVLFALGDKKRSMELVATCRAQWETSLGWNASGRLSKQGDGKIKLAWIWPFTKKFWILELAPDASWALAGAPNHKRLWLLSRTPSLSAEAMAHMRATASAQGFNTTKLVEIKQDLPSTTAPVGPSR